MAIKVLIVDDSKFSAFSIEKLLAQVEGEDYETDIVNSYDDALNQLASQSYDICLVDYNLGGENNGLGIIAEVSKKSIPFPLL